MQPRAQLSPRRLPRFRESLLAWYDANRRELPWRKTRDPYRVWISEIMLQQTRVAAVLPRYEQFMCKFPSVGELAAAKVTAVLAEWSGLGYYHRARNLHAAAKKIVRQQGGAFPQTVEGLREMPGIGRYTAAAIASIAFGEPTAVLDGNVERVLRRMFNRLHSNRESWAAAQKLIDHHRPGDFNQAMMELGATVCVPNQPLCAQCPIMKFCRTRGCGVARTTKPRQQKRAAYYSLAAKRGSVLLLQRSSKESLMPGMWELPKLDCSTGKPLFAVRHSITVTDYTVYVVAHSGVSVTSAKWIRISRLKQLPLTGLTKKILRKARIIE
ncbi:MAG TPA: A/G-specific adenine glycosylase [Terriglobales bacterium]|nr:A/G-specific adenine glycosylase [Terriglobales bacterium]